MGNISVLAWFRKAYIEVTLCKFLVHIISMRIYLRHGESRFSLKTDGSATRYVLSTALMSDRKSRKLVTKGSSTTEAFVVT